MLLSSEYGYISWPREKEREREAGEVGEVESGREEVTNKVES